MIDLTRALISYLRDDPTLAAQLGTFRGHAAVFGVSPVPEPTTPPFIVTQSISDETLGTKGRVVREIQQDIAIYDDDDGGVADIETIAEYIREKLRVHFDVPNWNMCGLQMSGPSINDVDDLHGRVLTARITLVR